jgi:dolichyl-phosphate-mannose--protein O-mannosyl transferase
MASVRRRKAVEDTPTSKTVSSVDFPDSKPISLATKLSDEALSTNTSSNTKTGPSSISAATDFVLQYERYIPYFLFFIALCTRFYRLSKPPGVVFDESHFVRFTNQYTARTYFFDIHPPLAKLTLWFVGLFVGHNQPNPSTRPFMSLDTDCNYKHINEDYKCTTYVYLRGVAAMASSISVLVFYYITRNFGGGPYAGIVASGLLLFDMLNCIQGRLVLLDAQLVMWCAITLLVAQNWWKRWNKHVEAIEYLEANSASASSPNLQEAAAKEATYSSQLMTVKDRLAWCVAVGFCCANSVSVKMTGLVTPGLIAVESFCAIVFLRRGIPFSDLLVILVVTILTYALWFRIHFAILTRHGDGDEEFMTPRFQSTLLESALYDPKATWEGFWWTFITLNIRMVVHNANILAPHPWMSSWNEWVNNIRGVSYYGKDAGAGLYSSVYLIGNQALHSAVLFAMAIFVVLGVVFLRLRAMNYWGRSTSVTNVTQNTTPYVLFPPSNAIPNPLSHIDLTMYTKFFAAASYCIAGYILNLIPYIGVARSTFIYHYMPALMYMQILIGLLVEQLGGKKYSPILAKSVLLVIGLVWLYFTPWIYAIPLTHEGHQRRKWKERWD